MRWAERSSATVLCWPPAESADFAVMVTGDKNLSYQQNLQGRELAIVVLSTNRWEILRENSQPIADARNAAKPGSFQVVMLETSPTRRVPHL